MLWFVLGFLASWITWSVVGYMTYSPKDYTQGLPEELRDDAPGWLKDAKGRKVGQFTIIAASDPNKASAQVTPTMPNRNPGVEYDDADSDGRVDSLLVTDSENRVFAFVVADGRFQSFDYSPDALASDSVSFFDGDMDGGFDYRMVPGRRMEMMMDSHWHELVPEGDGKGYVEIDGTRVPVEFADGMWRIVK